MKKVFLFFVLLSVLLLMVSCVNKEQPVSEITQVVEIALSQIEGHYSVEDYTDLGVWILSVESQALAIGLPEADVYTVTAGGRTSPLKRNPLKRDEFFALLSECLTKENIDSAAISLQDRQECLTDRANGEIVIESVYVQKAAAANGTTLYALTMEDYVAMKAAKSPFIYENGKLLRPVYVKSSDGYVYEMQRYYNARQAAASHTVDGAFEFLKNLPNPETYLFEGEPNRVSISQSGEITTLPPDMRDRVRDLGGMGAIQTSAYNIADGDSAMTLYINRNEIDVRYQSAEYFDIELNGTLYKMIETETAGIFSVIIPHTVTTNVDLVKNARFAIGTPFASGSGTQDSPFGIETADQLDAIRGDYLGTPGNGYYFIQIADIDMSETDYATDWIPVGDATTPFCGSYDGQNYTISHLTIVSATSDTALFGVTHSATLSNITLDEASVTGDYHTAILAGFTQWSAVSNCSASGTLEVAYRSGGLIAQNGTGTIADCTSDVIIHSPQRGFLGGLLAVNQNGTVTNCQAKSTITQNDAGYQGYGGFIAYQYEDSYLINCHANTVINTTGQIAGGFIGTNSGRIESCSASATINTSQQSNGGFVGSNLGRIESCSASATVVTSQINNGGFVGSNSGIIRKSDCSGTVTGGNQTGGFVGSNLGNLADVLSGNAVNVLIEKSYSTTDVVAVGDTVTDTGGFAGANNFLAAVKNSYALGSVTGKKNTGGFTGNIYHGIVENCYATGEVSSTAASSGGFAGAFGNFPMPSITVFGTITNCYWDSTTTGYTSSASVTDTYGKPTEEMKLKSTFTGWDFDSDNPVWSIEEEPNSSYPYLTDNTPGVLPGE